MIALEMSEKVARDGTMDALKGLAILLVVVGHAVQSSYRDFDDHPLFRLIYAFHMPLFMFISGYVAFYGGDNGSWSQLRKKARALVLPFVAWYLISYVINGTYLTVGIYDFLKRGALAPDWGLWFLWVLFLNFAVLAVALKAERYLHAWAFPLAYLVLRLGRVPGFGYGLLQWHFGFFALGFLAHRHAEWLRPRSRALAIMSSALFPAAVLFWHRTAGPSFGGVLAAELAALHVPWLLRPLIEVYRCAVPILGIVALWAGVRCLAILTPTANKTLQWFGLYTLDIYVTHQYLLRFGVGSGGWHVLTSASVALAGALAISFGLLRRNALVGQLLLGRPYPLKPAVTASGSHPAAGSSC